MVRKRYSNLFYLSNPNGKIQEVSDFMQDKRDNLFAYGYNSYCSKN